MAKVSMHLQTRFDRHEGKANVKGRITHGVRSIRPRPSLPAVNSTNVYQSIPMDSVLSPPTSFPLGLLIVLFVCLFEKYNKGLTG